MLRVPILVRSLALVAFVIGSGNLFIGFSNTGNELFLLIGFFCIFMSVGLWLLKEWARKFLLFSSVVIIVLYIILLREARNGVFHGFAVLALIFHAPLALFACLCLVLLPHKNIKAYFKAKGDGE